MIKTIGVIGAGTMGHSIAISFAIGGYEIRLYDVDEVRVNSVAGDIERELRLLSDEKVIEEAIVLKALQKISYFNDLCEAVSQCDYVIEAAPEIIELKQKLFKQLDAYCPEHTILASNTSSLALESMMELVSEERKQRMMINHWYNPAHIMPIVELSFFGNMPLHIYEKVDKLYQSINKQCVKVLKDVPGLVANRIQQGIAREVFSIIEQGIASYEDVDRALKFGPAFRYATAGQLEIADMGGLDIWCTVGDNLLKVMDNRQQSNELLRSKISNGELGIKTGKGFFEYDEKQSAEIKKQFNRRLIHQLKASRCYME
ncbi:3-hydroxyacyl-CoA dehydrogenase family protein [Psychrobacillus soli]|uniref:3-hydroxyacyl-CoA dehydrogenase family protein n=1 Tax=Psychrobacillus soli TaxID=1543965 RepID=A0A544TJT7_9BACI|nr:3-hydroxyacyl-CoA dehydrogenase NAD-binding domain-containing protein [Psychrobacillus soli]TQR17725.1 3-hydroxyacyl-CoA dehydrogenase family protein [Psychrobacillus soli]